VPSPADQLHLRHQQRQAGAPGIGPVASVPDAELIACLVAHGQPRWAAQEATANPQARLAALRFWVDVGDAGRGDKQARQRVDYIRACWSALRREDLISDDPRRDPAHIVDPADLL
jgi:hypothetical protein